MTKNDRPGAGGSPLNPAATPSWAGEITKSIFGEIEALLRKQHFARAADAFGKLVAALQGRSAGLDCGEALQAMMIERAKELHARSLKCVLNGIEDETLMEDFLAMVNDLMQCVQGRSQES